jgi:hypothetical protein
MARMNNASNALTSKFTEDPIIQDLIELGENPGMQAKLDPAFRNL